MEDQQIKDLFRRFDPELSSDFDFVSRLERNLNAVEAIRAENVSLKSRYRKAVAAAAFAGFAVGTIFWASLPYLRGMVANTASALPEGLFSGLFSGNCHVAAWSLTACAAVVAALSTYELSLSLLQRSAGKVLSSHPKI